MVFAILLGELVFGLVLGVTIGMYTVRALAEERMQGIRQTSEAIAAGLMPLVADQQSVQVDAQIQSVLSMTTSRGVRCIRVVDGAGVEIARSASDQAADCDCVTDQSDNGPIGLLTRAQVVEQPVVVNGLEVARAYVEFAPQGTGALRVSVLAALIIVLAAATVSAPWTAWLFMRSVLEPINTVREVAQTIANGQRGTRIDVRRRDEIGELASTINEMSDQLKEREDRLSSSYEEVSAAYNALREAKEQVEGLSRLKSDFVAVASHELRTPLSVVRVYAEMLQAGEFGRLGVRLERPIAALASAASRLTSIVSDLMDTALLERGLMPIDFAETHLEHVVRKAVEDMDFLARAKGVEVKILGALPQAVVWGDSTRLRQVLDNLLSNAVKYSDGASLVTVSLMVDEAWAQVEVVDGGRGISDADRSRLFALFGRLDVSDDMEAAGLGLGLTISQRIANAHGGKITHRSRGEVRGSIFVLHLPVGPADGMGPKHLDVHLPREEPQT